MNDALPLDRPVAVGRGDLGSEYRAYRLPGECVAGLSAVIDSVRNGWRRAYLDAKRGIIMLMAPSRAHESAGASVDNVLIDACRAAGLQYTLLRSTRLRRPEDPPNTGAEPDCAFYFGEKALAYQRLIESGRSAEAGDRFVLEHPPDLVVEVEATFLDAEKLAGYQELGVPEVWRTRGDAFERKVVVEMFGLSTGGGYASADESPALGLHKDVIAALINAPDKMMTPGSPYAEGITAAAKSIRAHAVQVGSEQPA